MDSFVYLIIRLMLILITRGRSPFHEVSDEPLHFHNKASIATLALESHLDANVLEVPQP